MNNLEIARVCHEVNREYCAALGDFSQLPWEEAPEWQRESALLGVTMHVENPTANASDSHNAWAAEKVKKGWRFGSTKDEEEKTHPCLVPFSELPREQRAKDYIFRAIVHALAFQSI